MKRLIYSGPKPGSPRTNIYTICDAMDWNFPSFVDSVANNYFKCKWGGFSLVEHEMKRIMKDRLNMDPDDFYTLTREDYRNSKLIDEAVASIQADIDKIYQLTGIQCKLSRPNPKGQLYVPVYN